MIDPAFSMRHLDDTKCPGPTNVFSGLAWIERALATQLVGIHRLIGTLHQSLDIVVVVGDDRPDAHAERRLEVISNPM